MRRTMLTDQQYNALVASRSGGPPAVSSQLLPLAQGPQYLSRKLYADKVDAYQAAAGSSTLGGSAVGYTPASNRAAVAAAAAESYLDPQDLRAQLAAERRGPLLPSSALVDYGSPPPFVDHVGSRGALAGSPVSPEVGGAYPSHYRSPQRGGQPVSNAELMTARARRSGLAAPYPDGYGNEVPVRRIPTASSYEEAGLYAAPAPAAAGILGPGAVRRGRELDRYLLSVQPEKLVRYASSVLAPDPALRRNGYPVGCDNSNPEDDRYSNYRRAKARRTGPHEFGGSGDPGWQREGEREIYREGEQRYRERRGGDSNRERGKRSPDRRQTDGSSSKSKDANRVDRPQNAPQSSGGKRGQQNGAQAKRSRDSEKPEKPEKAAAPKAKVENPDSDKDSELGSLCADLSDSDGEKVEKKSEDAATVIDVPLAGMIFGCSSATFHECMRLKLFGLPAKNKDDVLRVTPGAKVFLFNFDTKELSGIFEAISRGGWQIQPDAFRDFGGFPAQVQVCCAEQCPNITQSLFKSAILENYVNSTRFRFDLNSKQVKELVRMFRQAARNLPRQQQDPTADRYLSARLPPEDYLARGGPQQQRAYSRHPQARFGTSRIVPYDDARVMMISMSANKTTNVRRKSKSKRRASKRAPLKRGKKRKVSPTNKPESPPPPRTADNCSLYSLSGEMIQADDDHGTVNDSGCDDDDDDDDDTSNTNNAVIVFREGIETGKSRNVGHQRKEIVEPPPAAKGMIAPPSGPDPGLSPSNPPEEFPELLPSDLGYKQVSSFLEDDSYNDGNFRLAGSRADERGQGLGLDIPLEGALSSGNVIKSSDCTLSSMGEGLCSEVQGDVSATLPLVNLGGNNAPSTADGDDQLSEPDDEKRSEEGLLGETGVPTLDSNSHACEIISSIFVTVGKLPDVRIIDEVLIRTVEDGAFCTPASVDRDEALLEVIAGEVATGPTAPCVREEVTVAAEVAPGPEAPSVREEVVTAEALDKNDGLEVSAAEDVIDSEALCVSEEVTVAAEVAQGPEAPIVREEVVTAEALDKNDGLEVSAAEDVIDSEAPFVSEEVTVAAEVAQGPEAPSVREEVMTAEALDKNDDLEVSAAEDVIDSEAPCVSEEATVAAEVAQGPEALSVREEVMTAEALDKNDDLEVSAAEDVIDSEAPCVSEEVTVAAEVAQCPEAPSVGKEVMTTEALDKNDGLEVSAAEDGIDSEAPCVSEEVTVAAEVAQGPEAPSVREEVLTAEALDKNDDLEVSAAEDVIDSGVPCVSEEVTVAAEVAQCPEAPRVGKEVMTTEALDKNDGLEVSAAEDGIDSDAPCVSEEVTVASEVAQGPEALSFREGVMTAEALDKNDGLEGSAAEDVIDSEAPCVSSEEGMAVIAEAVGKDEELGVMAVGVASDSEAPCVREEVTSVAAEAGIDSEAACVIKEMEVAGEAKEVEEIGAVSAEDSACGREETMLAAEAEAVRNEDEELEAIAVDVATDSEAPCVREEVMIVTGQNEELEMTAAEVSTDSEAAISVREEVVMVAAEAVGKDEELEVIAAEVAVDSETASPLTEFL